MLLMAFCHSILAAETQIFDGPQVMPSDWSGNVQLQPTVFADAKVGDIVKVYITDVASGAQGSFKKLSDWTEIAAGTEYFDISGDAFSMKITEEILGHLKGTGLVIGGHDYTVVAVALVSEKTKPTVEKIIVSDPTVIENWNGLQIPADKFGDVKVGDKIKVYIASLKDNSQGSLKTMNSNWTQIAEGTEYFSISGESYSLDVTADILEKLQSTGLVISGQHYTIVKVCVISAAENNNEATNDNGMFPMTTDNDMSVMENADFRASTKTLTLGTYGIGGWAWEQPYDFSAYSKLTVELSTPAEQDLTISITYTQGVAADLGIIKAGESSVTIPFDNAYSKCVNNILIYATGNGVTTIVKLKNIYVTAKTAEEIDTGIETTASTIATQPVSTTYYGLDGRQIETPRRGVIIVKTRMSDGSVQTKKIIIK